MAEDTLLDAAGRIADGEQIDWASISSSLPTDEQRAVADELAVLAQIAAGRNCPRKFLINAHTQLLDQPNPRALDNVNTVEEYERAMTVFNEAPPR